MGLSGGPCRQQDSAPRPGGLLRLRVRLSVRSRHDWRRPYSGRDRRRSVRRHVGCRGLFPGLPRPGNLLGDHTDGYQAYPCCRSTHCAIDGALALRNRFGVSADEIEHIQISTYLVGYQQCGHSAGSLCPATFIDAKFSTPYVVACALLRGGVTVQDFAPAAIADPAAQDLLRRVTVRPEDCFTQAYPLQWGCALTARLKDGKVRRVEVQDASGSEKNSLGTKQLMDKSLSLLTPCFGAEAPALADKILCMDTLPFLPFF